MEKVKVKRQNASSVLSSLSSFGRPGKAKPITERTERPFRDPPRGAGVKIIPLTSRHKEVYFRVYFKREVTPKGIPGAKAPGNLFINQ